MSAPQQLDFLAEIEAPIDALLRPDDMFDRLDAKLLVRFKEDRRIERKPAQFQPSALGNYFSMWANTSPDGGIVIVGMSNDGSFEGLDSLGTERINALEVSHTIYAPDAICRYKRVAVKNARGRADFVLAIRVFYHPTLVVMNNRSEAYVRQGDRCHKMTADEIRELRSDKREISTEREPCNLDYPREFNRSAIREFAADVRKKKDWDVDHTEEDVLELMKLGRNINGRFIPSVACALLFANSPRDVAPGCRVRFQRFDGDKEGTGERWNAVKEEDVDGTIPEIIDGAAKVIRAQLRTFSRLEPRSGKFFAQPEYPPTAWYEAIVNACAHRSYGEGLRNTPIFVKMFDNRLVIESPGPFPPFVNPENIYESHNPKNPFLMEALRYMELVKCAHEGTRRMRDTMNAMNLPSPEFKQDQVGHFLVRVTLRNNVHQRKAWVDTDVTDLVGSLVAQTFNEKEKRVLNFVAEHRVISVSDAQRLTGMNWHSSKKLLMRLVETRILERLARKGVSHDTTARFVLRRPGE